MKELPLAVLAMDSYAHHVQFRHVLIEGLLTERIVGQYEIVAVSRTGLSGSDSLSLNRLSYACHDVCHMVVVASTIHTTGLTRNSLVNVLSSSFPARNSAMGGLFW